LDFARECLDILSGKWVQEKTSWNALMDDCRTSDRWTGLNKPRTHADHDKVMDHLREKAGSRSVAALIRADVIAA
jgi:hypothetical protein